MTEDASYGVLPPSSCYCDDGIALVRSSNISNDGIDYSSVVQVPAEWMNSERAKIKKNDILISIKGARAFFDMCVVNDEPQASIVNGSIFRFQCKQNYDPNFITFWLLSKQIQSIVYRERANLGISYISSPSLSAIQVPLIDIDDQIKILDSIKESYGILSNLDKKIEENKFEQEGINEKMSEIFQRKLHLPLQQKTLEQKVFLVPCDRQTDRLDVKGNQLAYFRLRKTFIDNPKFKSISSIAKDISNGLPERVYCDASDINARRYLLVADIKNGTISNISPSFIANRENKITLSEKTLLFTRKGTVGEVAMPKQEQLKYVPCYEIICVDFEDLEKSQIELIRLFFISKYGRLQVYFSCSGGQMPSISQERFKELFIPLLTEGECLELNNSLMSYIQEIETLLQKSEDFSSTKNLIFKNFIQEILLKSPKNALKNLKLAIEEVLK